MSWFRPEPARRPGHLPSTPRRLRDASALVVVLSFTLLSGAVSVGQFVLDVPPANPHKDYLGQLGDVYESMRHHLPAHPRLGYVSDTPRSVTTAARDFVLAQYFLVPGVLDYGRQLPISVGQFQSQQSLDAFLVANGYGVVAAGPPPWPVLLKRLADTDAP